MSKNVKLGSLGDIFIGLTYRPDDVSNEGTIVLRSSNIQNGKLDFADTVRVKCKVRENLMVKPSDILMCSRNGSAKLVGKCTLLPELDEAMTFGAFMTIIRTLHNPYLLHFFNSNAFRSQLNGAATTTINQITRKMLDDTVVPIFPPETEQYIVSVLNQIDDLIYLRQSQLEELDKLVKSRFIELCGMPGSDINGWGLTHLSNVCQINPKKGQDHRLVDGLTVSFVPMPAVSEHGDIDPSDIREYNAVKTGFTYFSENDVLFAKITPCMENGKGAVAKGLHNGIGFGSTEFHVLRPLQGKSNPYWIYTLTTFPDFRSDAANNMTGSAGQRRVPSSFLEQYRVAVPPIEIQDEFAEFVIQTDKLKFYDSLEVAA